MTRLEKCQYLEKKGYKYDPETGKVYGIRGKEITGKNGKGYIYITLIKNNGVLGHHFAWYWVYGNVDFIELDHKDRIPTNNRIDNLRILDRQGQQQNTNSKGFGFHKRDKKWFAQIWAENKKIWLGYYKTKEEARQAYLQAKQKYHLNYI